MSPEDVSAVSAEVAIHSPAPIPVPSAPPLPASAASGAAAMLPSAPVEAAPLSGIAAASAQLADAAASTTAPSSPTLPSPTLSAASAPVSSAAAPVEASAAARQLAAKADTPTLFGVPIPKLSTSKSPSPHPSPSPAGHSPPGGAALSSVTLVQPTPTPSPPLGLFQLPKLPMFGQQLRPETQRPAQAAPSETPKPETLLGFKFPKLPSFGQLPGSSAPWGLRLPFLSFQAAAPMPADGRLTDLIGPAEAPDLATGMHVPDFASTAPSAAAQPTMLAEQLMAPKVQESLPSARQEAPSITNQPHADAPTVMSADVDVDRMGSSDALDLAPTMMPATQRKAAKAASSSGSAPDRAAPVLPQQAGESGGYPVDPETVRGAVEALFMSERGAALLPRGPVESTADGSPSVSGDISESSLPG